MEKVQYPVLDPLEADPKFVDSIQQEISLWTAQFMSIFRQAFNPDQALCQHSLRQLIEPFNQWRTPIFFTIDDYQSFGQFHSLLTLFAILRIVKYALNQIMVIYLLDLSHPARRISTNSLNSCLPPCNNAILTAWCVSFRM